MSEQKLQLGINLIPSMPVKEVIETAEAAEDLGFEYFLLADEGFMQDVYVCLGAIARHTTRMRLGPVTNGYTRHPAATAVAMATLNELSAGRAFITLIAGGSVVLQPMNIPREKPLLVARETIEILRRLWTGEKVTWEGQRFQLREAQVQMGSAGDIPIWIAPRGEKMLQLAGELADGVMLMVKADLRSAFEIVGRASAARGRRPLRAYIERMAYTPEMIQQTAAFFPHVVVDTPVRQLQGFLSDEEIRRLQAAIASGGASAAARLITTEMIKGYKIAGTPEECSRELRRVIDENCLDVFVLNIVSGGFEKNVQMMKDVLSIVHAAEKLASARVT